MRQHDRCNEAEHHERKIFSGSELKRQLGEQRREYVRRAPASCVPCVIPSRNLSSSFSSSSNAFLRLDSSKLAPPSVSFVNATWFASTTLSNHRPCRQQRRQDLFDIALVPEASVHAFGDVADDDVDLT